MNNSIITKLAKYENIIKTHTIPELVHYDWNKIAFGFSSDDILEIPLSRIHIKWHGDMENVIGSDMGSYFKNTQYNELPPIDVSFDGKRFYLEDGHHRYGYAHKLGIKRVPVKVDITANPFIKLGFTIDDVVNYKKQALTESTLNKEYTGNIMNRNYKLFTNFLESVKDSDPELIQSINEAFNILHEAIDPNNMGWDSHLAREQERAYAGDEDDEFAWEQAVDKFGEQVGWTKFDGKIIPVFMHGYGTPEYVAGEWDAVEYGKTWSGPTITGVESGDATQVDGRWMTGDYPVFNTEEEATQFDEDSI